MIEMFACLIARVINFFLIDIVNEVQAWKLQVYESATCTNLQPVTLLRIQRLENKQCRSVGGSFWGDTKIYIVCKFSDFHFFKIFFGFKYYLLMIDM